MIEGGVDGGDIHGAHRAQVLGYDEIGGQVSQGVLVEMVEVLAGGHPGSDLGVDLRWLQMVGQRGGRHDPPGPGLRREVALEGHSDNIVAGTDGEEDLSRRRQQRDDTHRR